MDDLEKLNDPLATVLEICARCGEWFVPQGLFVVDIPGFGDVSYCTKECMDDDAGCGYRKGEK